MDFNVSISRDNFDAALKMLKKGNKGKKPFSLDMVFSESSLSIQTAAVSVEVSLTGTAKASLRFPGQFILSLYGTFPTTETLNLSLAGTVFKIEKLSLPCTIMT